MAVVRPPEKVYFRMKIFAMCFSRMIGITLILSIVVAMSANAQDNDRTGIAKIATESYFRLGCAQAAKKREIQQRAAEHALKQFADVQAKAYRIVRNRQPAEFQGIGGYGSAPIGPIAIKNEKGRETAEFAKREDRDAWVDHHYKIFKEKAKRLNELPTWAPPVLDVRVAGIGDCGQLISEIDDSPYGWEENMDLPNYRRELATITVVQVVDDRTILANVNGVDTLIEGVQTSTLTDDRKVQIASIALLHSTKQYTTVLGASRKVFLLKLASKETEKTIRDYTSSRIPKRIEFGHSRPWKNVKNELLSTGVFRRKDDKSILVIGEDGTEKSIEITLLSSQDRQYIKDVARTP